MKKPSLLLIALLMLVSIISAQEKQSDTQAEFERLSASTVSLYTDKKFDEALQPAKRALSMGERLFGNDHESVASALNNLAKVYVALGKIGDAEKLYQRALKIYEDKQGANSLKIADIFESLGFIEQFAKRNHIRAEAFYLRSLSIREKVLGQEHDDVLLSLGRLISIYSAKGEKNKVEPLLQRIALVREKTLSPIDPKRVIALQNYACFMRRTNRKAEAEELENRAYTALLKELSINSELLSLRSGMVICRAIKLDVPDQGNLMSKGYSGSGSVPVQLIIDESGKVISANALGGTTPFRKPCEHSALRSSFAPLIIGGKPVRYTSVITYTFEGIRRDTYSTGVLIQ